MKIEWVTVATWVGVPVVSGALMFAALTAVQSDSPGPICVDSVRIISERTSISEHHCGPGQTLTVYPAKDEFAVVAICRCADGGAGLGVTEL